MLDWVELRVDRLSNPLIVASLIIIVVAFVVFLLAKTIADAFAKNRSVNAETLMWIIKIISIVVIIVGVIIAIIAA